MYKDFQYLDVSATSSQSHCIYKRTNTCKYMLIKFVFPGKFCLCFKTIIFKWNSFSVLSVMLNTCPTLSYTSLQFSICIQGYFLLMSFTFLSVLVWVSEFLFHFNYNCIALNSIIPLSKHHPVYALRIWLHFPTWTSRPKFNLSEWKLTCPEITLI